MSAPQNLRRIPLFATLTPEELAPIADSLDRRSYEAGGVIVRQGEPGYALFLIEEGQVRVSKALPNEQEMFLTELTARGHLEDHLVGPIPKLGFESVGDRSRGQCPDLLQGHASSSDPRFYAIHRIKCESFG